MQPGHSQTKTRLAKFLEQRVTELRSLKAVSEIAVASGFQGPKMIEMIKDGSVRLPLDRVTQLAAALECDPRILFLLAFEQFTDAATVQSFKEMFGITMFAGDEALMHEIGYAAPTVNSAMKPST